MPACWHWRHGCLRRTRQPLPTCDPARRRQPQPAAAHAAPPPALAPLQHSTAVQHSQLQLLMGEARQAPFGGWPTGSASGTHLFTCVALPHLARPTAAAAASPARPAVQLAACGTGSWHATALHSGALLHLLLRCATRAVGRPLANAVAAVYSAPRDGADRRRSGYCHSRPQAATPAPRQRTQARRHPHATQQHAPAASLARKMPTQRAGQQLQLCRRLPEVAPGWRRKPERQRVACLQRCRASPHTDHSSTLLSGLPAVLPPPSAGASPSPNRPIMSCAQHACRRCGSDRHR